MGINRQKLSIEALSVFSTVFGAWFVNSLILKYLSETAFSAYSYMAIEVASFGAWFTLMAYLTKAAHPAPSQRILLVIGTIALSVLILSTSSWTNPELGITERITTWLKVYAHYLIAVPIFYFVGFLSIREQHV